MPTKRSASTQEARRAYDPLPTEKGEWKERLSRSKAKTHSLPPAPPIFVSRGKLIAGEGPMQQRLGKRKPVLFSATTTDQDTF